MPVTRNTGRSARSRAASLNVLSTLPSSIGRTVGGIVQNRKEEKEQAPIKALQQRLLKTQVESTESQAAQTQKNIAGATAFNEKLTKAFENFNAPEETKSQIKQQIEAANPDDEQQNDIAESLTNPIQTLRDFGDNLSSTSFIGKQVREKMGPELSASMDQLLSGDATQAAPTGRGPTPDADGPTQGTDITALLGGLGKQQQPPEETPAPIVPEQPVLKPGETALEKPVTAAFRAGKDGALERQAKPANVLRAEKTLELAQGTPGALDNPKLKVQIESAQKIIQRHEDKKFTKEQQERGFGAADERQKAGFGHQEELQKDRFEFEREKAKFGRQKAVADIARKEKLEGAKLEIALRKELKADPIVKEFRLIDSKYKGMQSVWKDFVKNPKGSRIAVDAAIVTLYNKILDPGSVVRESEFARTAEGQAMLKRLASFDEKIQQGGTGLALSELKEIVKTSEVLRNAAKVDFDSAISAYSESITDIPGVDPGRVMSSFALKDEADPVPTDSTVIPEPGKPAKTRIKFTATGEQIQDDTDENGDTRKTFNPKTGRLQ